MTTFSTHPARSTGLVLGLLVLGACDPDMITEQEQAGFARAFGGVLDFHTGDSVVEGTRFCPEWIRVKEGDEWVGNEAEPMSAAACFEASAGGSAALDASGCLVAGLGEGSLELAAQSCSEGDFVDDRFVVVGVAAAEVQPSWFHYVGALGSFDDWLYPGIPDDVRRPGLAGPVQVLADTEIALASITVAGNDLVGYSLADASATVTPPGAGSVESDSVTAFELAPGATLDLQLTAPGIDLDYPTLQAVELGPDATLTLMTVSDEGAPAMLGVVRDGDGEPIIGVPVAFETEEPYLMDVVPDDEEGPLYRGFAAVNDTCFEPRKGGRDHTATVTASYGGLSAESTVSWVQPAPEEVGPEWSPDANCVQVIYADEGCACSSGGGAGGLMLFGLLPLLRRRRRRVT